jgi:hypothetical protein
VAGAVEQTQHYSEDPAVFGKPRSEPLDAHKQRQKGKATDLVEDKHTICSHRHKGLQRKIHS